MFRFLLYIPLWRTWLPQRVQSHLFFSQKRYRNFLSRSILSFSIFFTIQEFPITMKTKMLLLTALIALFGLTACDSGGGSSSGGTESAGPSSGNAPAPAKTTIRLDAFSDFSCSSSWTNRNGARGLKAGSGSGTCKASFPGASGTYSVEIKVQAECDGSSRYRVSLDGSTVASGRFPYANGNLQCGECPDRNRTITIGTFQVNNGASIALGGWEDYGCDKHGAYAKWHEMIFKPVN